MDWQHRIQSLHFYDHTTTHDHIHAVRLIDLHTPVLHAQRHLPLHVEAPMGELNREAMLVGMLKKPRSKRAMHFNRTTDDLSRERIVLLLSY